MTSESSFALLTAIKLRRLDRTWRYGHWPGMLWPFHAFHGKARLIRSSQKQIVDISLRTASHTWHAIIEPLAVCVGRIGKWRKSFGSNLLCSSWSTSVRCPSYACMPYGTLQYVVCSGCMLCPAHLASGSVGIWRLYFTLTPYPFCLIEHRCAFHPINAPQDLCVCSNQCLVLSCPKSFGWRRVKSGLQCSTCYVYQCALFAVFRSYALIIFPNKQNEMVFCTWCVEGLN